MKNEENKIELRSEEFQDVLGQVPPWILRWGITVVFCIILILFIGSWFFKYPDIIPAQIKVTTANPPASIVFRASGKIKKMYVKDKQIVDTGDYLAVIENSARTEDIILLKARLNKLEETGDFSQALLSGLQLGDIQSTYIAFLTMVRECLNYHEFDLYQKKIDIQMKQISQQEQYYIRLKRQAILTQEQYAIATRRWEKDSLMHTKGGISGPEKDNSLTGYLQSRQNIESSQASLENQQMQIVHLKAELLNLQLEKLEREAKIINDYENSKEQLLIALKNWELQYALISPIHGQVTFMIYWSENHTITAGETAFVVVPQEAEEIVGKALLPIARSGKVKEGQVVNVRFDNYPDQEFGMVKGVVSSISLVPVENNYIIGVNFPKGLQTNYKQMLPLSQEMTGNADIITEDLRLIQRFLKPIRKILSSGSLE